MEKVLEFENGKIRVIIEVEEDKEETEPEVQPHPMSAIEEHLTRMWKPAYEEQIKETYLAKAMNAERKAKLLEEIRIKKQILKNIIDNNQVIPENAVCKYNDMLKEYKSLNSQGSWSMPTGEPIHIRY